MKKYYYIFGYATPEELELNSKSGTDFENSSGLFIEAESKEKALEWGNKLADKFISTLYKDPSLTLEKLGYGGFIEDDGATAFLDKDEVADMKQSTREKISKIPVVVYGQDFDLLTFINK